MFPFETVGLLGSGSYGTVYKIKQQNQYYALKRCEIFDEPDEKQLSSGSIREYIFHQSIREIGLDPYLCTASIFWKGSKHFYFILPLFDCNLLQFSRQYKNAMISFEDFCFLAKQLKTAVESLHNKGWIHRDIKPENIYLKQDGSLALGDFNLVRFTDICMEEIQQDSCLSIPRGNSSTLVCTLWTRPPELIVNELQSNKYIETGEEIDTFSVGATLLSIAYGNYVFGKCIRGESENLTLEYIQGYFATIGIDSFIQNEYDFDILEIDIQKLPLYSTSYERLQQFLPKFWTSSQKIQVSKILSSLLDPLPYRRGTLKLIDELQSTQINLSSTSIQYIQQASVCKLLTKNFLIHRPILSTYHTIPTTLLSTDTLWSTCGQLRMPLPLALHAVYARRTLEQPNSKSIIYLLRIVHRFPSSTTWNMSVDNILSCLPFIRLRKDIWTFTRSIEKEPFLICCFAAWLHCFGTIPSNKDLLLSSNEMNQVLKSNDCFFGSFGQRWKSQREMLYSWRRLSFQVQEEFEFEESE